MTDASEVEAPALKRSEGYDEFKRRSHCPRCHKYILFTRTFEFDGTKKRVFTEPKDPAAVAECPKCDGRWFVFDRPSKLEAIETATTTEVDSRQEIHLDNSRGTSPLQRKVTISREWTQTLTIGAEVSESGELGAGIGTEPLTLSAKVAQAVKATYSISQEQKRTYSDEVQFEVPPGVWRTAVLTFQRVLQHGVMRLSDDDGDREFPFSFVANLSLDVAQEDVRDP
jgi:hypothetical protein